MEGLREGDSDGQVSEEQTSSPSEQTTSGCNGEGWVVVEMAKIGTLYLLPFIIGVWVKSVNSHRGRGIWETVIEKPVLMESRLNSSIGLDEV